MNVAIIKNNIVNNIAVFEDIETAQEMFPDAICLDAAVTGCGIGWAYNPDTGECIAPPEPDQPDEPDYKAFLDGLMGGELIE